MGSLFWMPICAPRNESYRLSHPPSWRETFWNFLPTTTSQHSWPTAQRRLTELSCNHGEMRPMGFSEDGELRPSGEEAARTPTFMSSEMALDPCHGLPLRWAIAFLPSSWLIHSDTFNWSTAEDSPLKAIQVWSHLLSAVWNLLGYAGEVGGHYSH